MIVDIVFLCIIAVWVIIAIFSNPIRNLIQLVLFIGLTYAFFFILVGVLPSILSSFNVSLDEIASQVVMALSELDMEIESIGSSLGFTTVPLADDLLSNAQYTYLMNGIINAVIFIVSAVLAFLVSLALSYLFKFILYVSVKGLKDKVNSHKGLKRGLGAATGLILSCFFVLSIASPYHRTMDKAYYLEGVFDQIHLLQSLQPEYSQIEGLLTELRTFKVELEGYVTVLDEYDTRLDGIETTLRGYEGIVLDYIDKFDELIEASEALLARDDVEEEDKETLRNYVTDNTEISNDVDTYRDDINEAYANIADSKQDISDAQDDLRSGIDDLDQQLLDFQDQLDQFKEYDDLVSQYQGDIDKILEMDYFKGSFLDFLGFDLGYEALTQGEVSYESTLHQLGDEVLAFYNGNMEGFKGALGDLYAEAHQEITDLRTEIQDAITSSEDYLVEAEEKVAEFDDLQTRINQLEEFENFINEMSAKYGLPSVDL